MESSDGPGPTLLGVTTDFSRVTSTAPTSAVSPTSITASAGPATTPPKLSSSSSNKNMTLIRSNHIRSVDPYPAEQPAL